MWLKYLVLSNKMIPYILYQYLFQLKLELKYKTMVSTSLVKCFVKLKGNKPVLW